MKGKVCYYCGYLWEINEFDICVPWSCLYCVATNLHPDWEHQRKYDTAFWQDHLDGKVSRELFDKYVTKRWLGH